MYGHHVRTGRPEDAHSRHGVDNTRVNRAQMFRENHLLDPHSSQLPSAGQAHQASFESALRRPVIVIELVRQQHKLDARGLQRAQAGDKAAGVDLLPPRPPGYHWKQIERDANHEARRAAAPGRRRSGAGKG